jgi:hypothetical protein
MMSEERDSRLDRLYREAERSAPAAHLDAAILAAARREVGARPRSLSETARRWRVPVSIAALVVLSVSLVTLVQREDRDELALMTPGPPAASKPPQAAAPAPPAPAQPAAEKPPAEAPAMRPRAAPSAVRGDERPMARNGLEAMPDSARRDAVTGPASGAGAASAPAPAAPPALQPFPAPPRVAEREAASPQAAPAGEARAIRPAAAPPGREARSAVADAPPAEEESAKALAGSMALKSGARVRAPAWQGYEKEPPQKWLDRIAELRRQGETALAEEMVAEFKRRFPEHPLPADLDKR